MRTFKLPAQSTDLNAHAERFVGSIKEERLSQIIPLGERHLRMAVTKYPEHYQMDHNHQGLANESIEPLDKTGQGRVACRERLGSVLSYFYRRAA